MRHHNVKCIVAAAALLALCGCSRTAIEDGGNAGREIGYTIAVSPVVKGALINTSGEDKPLSGFLSVTDNFTVDAFNDAGTQTITATTVTWNADHSRFESDPVSYWPQATRLTFLASANMPTGEQAADIATVSATKDGITLTYKAVPTGAADQRDILLGTYVGADSNTGLAEIRFEHPLTAVIFKVGTVSQKITEVRLKGLATAGKVTLDASHKLGGWTAIGGGDISSYDLTASVSNSESLTKGTTVGTPFVVIPQDLAEQHVEVTVTLADGTLGTITLSEGKWLAGKTNTYTLNYIDWNLTVTGPEVYNGGRLGGDELGDDGLNSYDGISL